MATPLTISKEAVREAVFHSRSSADEVCGLFVQGDYAVQYLPCKNQAPDPSLHFEIGVQQLFDILQAGLKIVALFHSHPNGRMSPSSTDILTFPVHYVEHGLIYAGDEILYYNADEKFKVLPNAIKEGITV